VLKNGEPIIDVEDQLPNVLLFLLTTNWYNSIKNIYIGLF